jgi:tetratricopeptide (TPR) repeat protein
MDQKPYKRYNIKYMWHELKRRRVFRVITTYAATAYIIIELTNNISEPLHLPEWTATLVILLLALGLPVTIVLTWLFDITPEGIKKSEKAIFVEEKKVVPKPAKKGLKANDIIITVLLVIVVLLAYPRISGRVNNKDIRLSDGNISIAVIPFLNMTNRPSLDDWQEGVQVNLITSLSSTAQLKIKQAGPVNNLIKSKGLNNNDLIKPSIASRISKKVGANVFICGTIKQAASIIRINAQLVNTKTGDTFRSFQIDGKPEDLLIMTDSLSLLIKNSLIISLLGNTIPYTLKNSESTSSPEAYNYFAMGTNSLIKFDYSTASKWYKRAFETDTNYTFATILLSFVYINQDLYDDAKIFCLKAYNKKNQLDIQNEIWTNYIYSLLFATPNEELKYLKQLKEFDSEIPIFYYYSGIAYNKIYEYKKAIPEFEKALLIYQKSNLKPVWAPIYNALGYAYHQSGLNKKEAKLYRKSEKYFPDDPTLISRKAVLAFSESDTVKAEKYIKDYIRIARNSLIPESDIETGLAEICMEAGRVIMAENYYRQALLAESESAQKMSDLAWFLIDTGKDINEGLTLINKALELRSNDYLYLDCKGWGLYKLGEYEEALKSIKESWDLRPVYNNRIFLHKQTVERHF